MPEFSVRTFDHNKLRIFSTCPVTKEEYGVVVDFDGWKKWQYGELIHKALPDLGPEERHFLRTGYTPAAWKRLTCKA